MTPSLDLILVYVSWKNYLPSILNENNCDLPQKEIFSCFLSYTVRQVSNRTASINQIIAMTKVPDIKKKIILQSVDVQIKRTNFFIVKFVIGNRNFFLLENWAFCNIAYCQYHVCNLSSLYHGCRYNGSQSLCYKVP